MPSISCFTAEPGDSEDPRGELSHKLICRPINSYKLYPICIYIYLICYSQHSYWLVSYVILDIYIYIHHKPINFAVKRKLSVHLNLAIEHDSLTTIQFTFRYLDVECNLLQQTSGAHLRMRNFRDGADGAVFIWQCGPKRPISMATLR